MKEMLKIVLLLILLCFSLSSLLKLTPKTRYNALNFFSEETCDISEYQFVKAKKVHLKQKIFSYQARKYEEGKFPETHSINEQELKLLKPSSKFPFHPPTVYFKKEPFFSLRQVKYPEDQLIEYNISKKGDMVIMNLQNTDFVVFQTIQFSGLIFTDVFRDANIQWNDQFFSHKENHEFLTTLHKYNKYYSFLSREYLIENSGFYPLYSKKKSNFPKDYNYIPYSVRYTENSNDKLENIESDFDFLLKIDNKQPSFYNISNDNTEIIQKGIIQKYINNPLLFDNKKFTTKFFVLVTGFSPLKIYLFNESISYIASHNYSNNIRNLSNNEFIHFTKTKNSKKMPFSEIKKHFNNSFEPAIQEIKDIIIKTLICYQQNEIKAQKIYSLTNNNLFEIFSFNILIDSNFRPWLVGVNTTDFTSRSKLEARLFGSLVSDCFNILGIVPYKHRSKKDRSLFTEPTFENKTQEIIYETLCEFERPSGDFERIFPLLSNYKKYSKFFESNYIYEDYKLWNTMEEINY